MRAQHKKTLAWSAVSGIIGVGLTAMVIFSGWMDKREAKAVQEGTQAEQIKILQDRMDRCESRINYLFEHHR